MGLAVVVVCIISGPADSANHRSHGRKEAAAPLRARPSSGKVKTSSLPRLWVVQVSKGSHGWFDRTTLRRVRADGIDAVAVRVSALGRNGKRELDAVRSFAAKEGLYLIAVLPGGMLRSATARHAASLCANPRFPLIRCAAEARSVKAAAKAARTNDSVRQLVAAYVSSPGRLSSLTQLPTALRRRILVIAPLSAGFHDASAWGAAIGRTSATPSVFIGAAPQTSKASPAVEKFAALLAHGGSASDGSGSKRDTAPPAPTELAVTALGGSSASLSWSASATGVRVVGYRVFLNGKQVGTSSSTGYVFSSLACQTSYMLGVEAVDRLGRVSSLAATTARTTPCPDTQAPSTPNGLGVSGVTVSSATLSWNPSSDNVGVAGYRLFLNGSRVGTSSATRYVFAGLTCQVGYTLGVAAVDTAGNVSPLATTVAHAAACADTQPPTTPTRLTTSSLTQTSIALSWGAATDNVGVAAYRLFLNGSQIGTTGSTSYSFTGLSCGTSYLLGVIAVDAAGNRSGIATVAPATAACTAPSTGTANLWVDGGSGSCARSAVPAVYNPSTACGSFNAAYQAAAQGDLVLVRDGAYGTQTFTAKPTFGWTQPVTFEAENPFAATIEPQSSGHAISVGGQSWITIEGFNINGYQTQCPLAQQNVYPGCGNSYLVIGDSTAGTDSHITIADNRIDVGKLNGGGSMIMLYKPQDWQIAGNSFGPSCCGADSVNSPVAITIGKPSSGANDCAHEGCNVAIDNNVFQYADLRHAGDWPSSGWGPAPEQSCTDTVHCHLDVLHIGGLIGGQIDFNQFLGDDCEGIYMEGGGYQGNDNRNIDIIGNSWSLFSDHCNGGLYVKCGGTNTCGGTWNIGFNEGNDLMTLGAGWSGAETGTVVNIYGNYTYLLMSSATGNSAGCYSGLRGNVAINYQYNVWLGTFGGGGNTPGPCSITDTIATSPSWVNDGGAPSVGIDMHKTGPLGTADNYVPCFLLSIGSCPATDYDGDPFAAFADAGADQR